MSQKRSRLGQWLLQAGLLTEAQYDKLQADRARTGKHFATLLGTWASFDYDRAHRTMAEKLGLQCVDLDQINIPDRVLELIPGSFARSARVLPVTLKQIGSHEVLFLAMQDPLDAEAITEVQRTTGRRVKVLLTTPAPLERALERYYRGRNRTRDALGRVTRVSALPTSNETFRRLAERSRDLVPSAADEQMARDLEPLPVPEAVDDAEIEDVDPNFAITAVPSKGKQASVDDWMEQDPLLGRPRPRLIPHPETGDLMPAPRPVFELPVELPDEDSPFSAPSFQGEIMVGLDATGIMPALNLSEDIFDPPPIDPEVDGPDEDSELISSDDLAAESQKAMPTPSDASEHRSKESRLPPKLPPKRPPSPPHGSGSPKGGPPPRPSYGAASDGGRPNLMPAQNFDEGATEEPTPISRDLPHLLLATENRQRSGLGSSDASQWNEGVSATATEVSSTHQLGRPKSAVQALWDEAPLRPEEAAWVVKALSRLLIRKGLIAELELEAELQALQTALASNDGRR